MRNLIKGLAFLVCASAFGQYNQNTVTPPPIFVNKITTGAVQIPSQYYVGQINHLIRLVTSNQPAHVCPAYAAPNILLRFQGSWDNVTYFDIGAPITYTYTQPDGTFGALRPYSGAYPYLQVNLVSADTTNCQHTVYYSGTNAGAFYADSFKWQDLGYVTATVKGTSAGLNVLTNGGTPLGLRVVVYAVAISPSQTTAMSYSYFCEATVSTTHYWEVGSPLLTSATTTAMTNYILPYTGKAYFSTNINTTGLGIDVTNATSDTAISVVYRFE